MCNDGATYDAETYDTVTDQERANVSDAVLLLILIHGALNNVNWGCRQQVVVGLSAGHFKK